MALSCRRFMRRTLLPRTAIAAEHKSAWHKQCNAFSRSWRVTFKGTARNARAFLRLADGKGQAQEKAQELGGGAPRRVVLPRYASGADCHSAAESNAVEIAGMCCAG